ncbi:MAG TPA: hypothetical protein VFP72_04175 [Kineosporiaceae bacterium]|nr:hypothetical protein [Kineosporiaceae bacterium]
MIQLTSWPVVVVEYGMALFCFLDVLFMREPRVRWMPRCIWALLLLCFPAAGSLGWIAAGRPWRHHRIIPDDIAPDGKTAPGDPWHLALPPTGPLRPTPGVPRGPGTPPDSAPPRSPGPRPGTGPALTPVPPAAAGDPQVGLIDQLFAVHQEHERTLLRWEDDLRRREAELRRREAAAGPAAAPGAMAAERRGTAADVPAPASPAPGSDRSGGTSVPGPDTPPAPGAGPR